MKKIFRFNNQNNNNNNSNKDNKEEKNNYSPSSSPAKNSFFNPDGGPVVTTETLDGPADDDKEISSPSSKRPKNN
ncbi:MAG: hypothetical protein H0W64_04835 [Gammaproteobacteria bacterium]|nr:hypothetical protein [Gammaproteobacteria bacterium]